jgi:hypothetical protein
MLFIHQETELHPWLPITWDSEELHFPRPQLVVESKLNAI